MCEQGTKRKFDAAVGPESVVQWASTDMEQETFDFLWCIKNYGVMSESCDEIESPIFGGESMSNHQWQMAINPEKNEWIECFGVYLIMHHIGGTEYGSNQTLLKVRFQISLLDPDGIPMKVRGNSAKPVYEFGNGTSLGWPNFLGRTRPRCPNRLLDTLKIHCRVWIEGGLRHKTGTGGAIPVQDTEREIKRRRHEQLSSNFHDLLHDTSFADVVLSTGTTSFSAHKSILSARSPVFRAMFSIQMIEAEKNSVQINDFEPDTVKAMLEYIYTGDTSGLGERAIELMQIAEKYDLGGLREDCERSISRSVTVENASEVLVLAHLHNALGLKAKVIEFIKRNEDDVKKSQSFHEVAASNPNVLLDIYISQ